MSNFKLKCLLCGSAGAGKTSLKMRFVESIFQETYQLTIGVDVSAKEVQVDNHKATLSIWDIGGQGRFADFRTMFYRGATGVLLVFDLSRPETWDAIKKWREEIIENVGDIPFVLVGNKLDLLEDIGEVVDREECRRYAESEGSIYIETSAKNNIAVDDSFQTLTKLMIKKNI